MDKQQKTILTVVGILLAVAIVATVIVYFVTRNESDFTPPDFDVAAKKGYPTVTDPAAQFQKVTASENFAFSMCLCPTYENGAARICFASEITNQAYLLIRLYDADGELIGQSGLVKPGQYVESVAISLVPTKDMDISAKIFSYEPNTYYSMGTVSGELNLRVAK